jgi:hypothetical protein
MADYYSILAKAAGALAPNTASARQQIYARARSQSSKSPRPENAILTAVRAGPDSPERTAPGRRLAPRDQAEWGCRAQFGGGAASLFTGGVDLLQLGNVSECGRGRAAGCLGGEG